VKVSKVVVSKGPAGRYFVSLGFEQPVARKPVVLQNVGVDLRLTHHAVLATESLVCTEEGFVSVADSEKIENPRPFVTLQRKLARLQRRLKRMQKGSRRREKLRLKIARLHAKITDVRRDFLHKSTTKLIRENQVIVVEDLSVANMKRNPHLAKGISDVGWGEYNRMLTYKTHWYGRTLVTIDRWYPSSKTCSDCGHKLSELALNIREWTCPECGCVHDRDVNAAKNILAPLWQAAEIPTASRTSLYGQR